MGVLFNHYKVHIAFSIWILIFAVIAYTVPTVLVFGLGVVVLMWSIVTIANYMYDKYP